MTKQWMMPPYRTAVTGHARVAEPSGVGLALVAQYIGFGGDDRRRRQPAKLARSDEAVGWARWALSVVC
jgi:hypothetical protein